MARADDNGSGFWLRATAISVAIVALIGSAYLFGAYSYSRNIFPINALRSLKARGNEQPAGPLGTYDSFGRLTYFPGKTEVECPVQDARTAVLLAIGQSNSANHASARMTTRHPHRIFNFYDGKCYVASSPLLGATNEQGEFVTPLADALVTSNTFRAVIVVAAGIGNSSISRWQENGDLNEMLLATLTQLNAKYEVTHIIWHQGESDFRNWTSAKVYAHSFRSLLSTLEALEIRAPAFIAMATKCGRDARWTPDNPTAVGQRSLIDNKRIFLGADTDTLLAHTGRQSDDCHLSEEGQYETAAAFARSIAHFQQRNTTEATASARSGHQSARPPDPCDLPSQVDDAKQEK